MRVTEAAVTLLLLGAAAAHADETVSGYEAGRLECLMERTQRATAGGEVECHRLSADQRTFMGSIRTQFCTDPDQFCETINQMQPSELSRKFVTASCEPGVHSDHFHTMEFSIADGADSASADRNLGPLM
ncbi:MAG TPA: hypothetical protein VL588_12500, partial [Bdellovibrionota bacterium]|nr:hypothetical protein [Bdellovibrionota bacterium]